MPVSLDLAKECAGRQVGHRQVPSQRLLPALERQLPDGKVLLRPLARNRGADVEPAELLDRAPEELVDLVLGSEVGAEDRRAAELLAQGLRPFAALVEVESHAAALGGELARTGGADSA